LICVNGRVDRDAPAQFGLPCGGVAPIALGIGRGLRRRADIFEATPAAGLVFPVQAGASAGRPGASRSRSAALCAIALWNASSASRADSDEVARAFRDDVARDYEMMSPGFGASLA
jgi:hypothetical protein